jgi:hypothetical protein
MCKIGMPFLKKWKVGICRSKRLGLDQMRSGINLKDG